jgi:hypothetical protein
MQLRPYRMIRGLYRNAIPLLPMVLLQLVKASTMGAKLTLDDPLI